MEHSCHSCGAAVEDGTSFCPQCGAPQIRVPDAENIAVTPPLPPGTPGDLQPPAQPVFTHAPQTLSPIHWPHAVPSAALAGLLMALAWTFPFLNFFFWMVAGGALAVALYRRREPQAALSTGAGARIGVVGGIFGFFMFAFMLAVQLLANRSSGRLRETIRQVMEQAAARNPDPRTQEMVEKLMSPQGIALLMTIFIVFAFGAFLVFAAIGGALAARFFQPRKPPAPELRP